MSDYINPALRPRRGTTLKVLTIERISTEHQDERALDDQRAKSKRLVSDHYDGEIDWKSIASRGSGEVIDRDSYREMEDLIDSGWPDLIVVEDLGRICRRLDALRICELCEDFETRLIAINDHVDTFKSDWKTSAMFSTLHHERHNQDTSDRIKRTFRNRFSEGSILVVLPYGYVRAEGAKTDNDLSKDPDAEKVYNRWFEMLDDGASYSEVADWLNDQGVPTGPGCRLNTWSTAMVSRITHNTILKGSRRWNRRVSKRNNRTGKRRSVTAAEKDHLTRHCEHLAFIEPIRYDRILRKIDRKNAKYRRGKQHAKDKREGMPRSRTVWPGQSMYCGICGRVLYYGAHGQPQNLMCKGAIEYKCWNGASANGRDTSRRICESVIELVKELPEFDEVLMNEVRNQVQQLNENAGGRLQEIRRDLDRVEREIDNVLNFIRSGSGSRLLKVELNRLENRQADLADELRSLQDSSQSNIVVPSVDDIRSRAIDIFKSSLPDPQFGRLMNQFIEDLVVLPVQLIDGGKVGLRATFTVNLLSLIEGEPLSKMLDVDVMKHHRTVDLFEVPQRVKFMAEVARQSKLNGESGPELTEREIAERLKITQPAVQRAKRLYREMRQRGLDDPYQVLTAPPAEGKLRRHLHPRYRFDPL
ncbi:recombinase family protein [Allorhodopirellula heiligendammensis]|uniref:Recombinase n=1 Tax=Allorhodopirellula heiligendammensis TaxID=2714739 RepID=A0A5C6BE52_9BACT|nr:recombinase family protein [Allorhodopirellula heiligendammensis]TWU09751.1 Recombinase [Allorhodopirellula heiligendammensis]